MKIIVLGNGQLANELKSTQPDSVDVIYLDRSLLDISDAASCKRQFEVYQPNWIINAAAYTAVDKAESDKAAAFSANATAVEHVAVSAKGVGANVLHVSTDFVFDGTNSSPYSADEQCKPLGVYGESKFLGEQHLVRVLPEAIIIRTAWVYSTFGNNFVKTMMKLMSERPEIGVISDQIGTPTYARGLAITIWQSILGGLKGGLYHWSDSGVASWYDFSVAIQELCIEKGLLNVAIPIWPISTSMFPTAAKRPAYSVLDKSKISEALLKTPNHWRVELSAMLEQLKVNGLQP